MRSRVLLVEDSPAMREAVSGILTSECEVVGYADDGRYAMAAAEKHRPDVILLDISLPGLSGMALLPLLRAALPRAAIVMLTNHATKEYVEEAFRRGADSYVLKNEAHRALMPAIRRGRQGARVLSRVRAEISAARSLLPG